MEVVTAAQITATFNYKAFVQERVDTFEVYPGGSGESPKLIINDMIPVGKFQTLDTTTIPLLEGKEAESAIHPIMKYQRQYAGDEALQLSQITWNAARPGILAFAGVRPQMTEELQNMGAVLAANGYTREFCEYAHYYSNIKKGYASPESLIGFTHEYGTVEYYLARCRAVKEYWINATAELDLKIILGFIAAGSALRRKNQYTAEPRPTL